MRVVVKARYVKTTMMREVKTTVVAKTRKRMAADPTMMNRTARAILRDGLP